MSVLSITSSEELGVDVAVRVERNARADAARARAQPSEEERRKEDAEASRRTDGDDVPDRENRRADEQARTDRRAEHLPFGRDGVVEARLQIAAIERLLRQRDQEKLPEDVASHF